MRYAINFDKLVNRFVPHYIGGRKLILYLQAIIKPLQSVNEAFVAYAKETRIEASMTSQVLKFEWYLNRKFAQYFADGGQIVIKNSEHLGVPIYHGDASVPISKHIVLRFASEGDSKVKLYHQNERTDKNDVSFIVVSPAIDLSKISADEYEAMLRSYIDKYRLSGKTYKIKYINNEGI